MNTMHRNKGFTLIELMIVVAIVAILAAVALPQYTTYVTRAKVSELVLAADGCKTSVAEYYQSQSAWPATLADSGCSTQSTKYVASLTVGTTGTITVTPKTGPGAIDPAVTGTLSLVPSAPTSTGNIDWSCTSTIDDKYLPASCRG